MLMADAPIYTEEELSVMTISQIKDLASELGITITKIKKAEIIAEFLGGLNA